MKVVDIENKDSIKIAAEILKTGGILVFPTDTVYGIGCLLNEEAIKKLYKIKNRLLSQPTAILINKKYSPKISKKDYQNGKLTIIINKERFNIDVPNILIKNNKVGLRIPKYPWLKNLIDITGPIAASSANKKGEQPPVKFEKISQNIISQADLIIKTDKNLTGKPSKIYDLELKKYYR